MRRRKAPGSVVQSEVSNHDLLNYVSGSRNSENRREYQQTESHNVETDTFQPIDDGEASRDRLWRTEMGKCDTFSFLVIVSLSVGLVHRIFQLRLKFRLYLLYEFVPVHSARAQ